MRWSIAELDRLLSQLRERERVDPTFSSWFNAPTHVKCACTLEAEPSTSCSNGPPASSGSRFAIKSDVQVQETKLTLDLSQKTHNKIPTGL